MRAEQYVLAGRYRLMERLGEGGAGTVWRAVDETLQRNVAVKQVRVPRDLDPRERAQFAERAIHEARAAGRLRDPAIVLIHDVVLEGDQPWIIMDLSAGRSLEEVIRDHGPLPAGHVARIGLRVLSALEVAHAHGILHQDVKPANILIEPDGSAVLTDFGIATPMGGQGQLYGTAGSPGYMAPERLNQHGSGPSSDLWSLAAGLYTAVEGRPPFERAMPAAVAAAVLLHDPPFPRLAGRELGGLLMAMLAKDPAARPAAAQVRQRLMNVTDTPTVPTRRRRRSLLVALALAAVVLLGAGGWYGVAVLTAPETGRFAAAPDPCTLLTDADAAGLLGGRAQRTATREGECRWQVREGSEVARVLTVRTRAEPPSGGRGGPGAAEVRFASERDTRAAGEGTTFRRTTGKVIAVPGLGDAAFVQDSYELYVNSTSSGDSDSTVLLRTSNLIGEVIYHRERVPATAPASRDTSVRAARLVFAGLK
ncbi:serine/threonine-protein kinase [Nonomuraea sediminis]|uniref:serine/threonine-protein kinase n=1 Tax=Nonomuraea sediminis TaxID=2835864 RepID=UPI001BDC7FE8|nr:serine/threonine-protein kinase [Nonomuraea sediminis]